MLVNTTSPTTSLASVPALVPLVSVSSLKSWDLLRDASKANALVPRLPVLALQTLRFLGGDYWQNWACWVGTQVPNDAKDRAAIVAEIERCYVPRPLIEEISERHVAGVVGQEPAFEFVSDRDSKADEDALDAFEKIKDIIRKRASRLRQKPALPDPSAPPLSPEEAAQKAADEALAADAWDALDISREFAQLQSALGLPVEDDFPLPDDLPPAWKTVIERAKEVQTDIAEEQAFVSEVNSAVGAWWDKRKGHELIQDFTRALVATGRASFRFYVPSGFVDENQKVTAKGWIEALDLIYLEVPEPGSATVAVNRSKREPASMFCYKGTNTNGDDVSLVEVTFLKEEQTIIRILQDDVVQENGEASHDCAGELFVDEATSSPLISAALIRNQNALNVVNTMLLHNGNLAGHRARDFFNTQRPQVEVDDPRNPGKKVKVDAPLNVGPGSANFHTGIAYQQDGKTVLASGNMVITDPVDPKPLIEAISQFEDNMYAATSQRHVKISGDATASAVSRVQARYEFLSILKKSSPKIEGVLRSRLRGAVALAMSLAKDTKQLERFKKLRASVVCRLNTGPVAPDERAQILREYQAKVIPLEMAQTLLQIEDVDAAAAQLRVEEDSSPTTLKARAESMLVLTQSGVGIEEAALTVGFDPKTAKRMAQSQPKPQPQPAALPAPAPIPPTPDA